MGAVYLVDAGDVENADQLAPAVHCTDLVEVADVVHKAVVEGKIFPMVVHHGEFSAQYPVCVIQVNVVTRIRPQPEDCEQPLGKPSADTLIGFPEPCCNSFFQPDRRRTPQVARDISELMYVRMAVFVSDSIGHCIFCCRDKPDNAEFMGRLIYPVLEGAAGKSGIGPVFRC